MGKNWEDNKNKRLYRYKNRGKRKNAASVFLFKKYFRLPESIDRNDIEV